MNCLKMKRTGCIAVWLSLIIVICIGMRKMNSNSQRITSTINLGALVLISSFLQHNRVIQYALLAVAVLIVLLGLISFIKGLSQKRFKLTDFLAQDDCDYVSLGIWLLVTSLLFYLGHQTGGFIALGILILLSLATLLCKILPSGKTE